MTNSNERIEYLDVLKGFAIFLVVMGHSLAWCFIDYLKVYTSEAPEKMFIWRLIYSFHMPLFFYISGYLFNSTHYRTPIYYIWHKAKHLMLPFFTMGTLSYFYSESFGYWFLIVLFQLFIIARLIEFASRGKNMAYILYCIIIFILLYTINQCIKESFAADYLYTANLWRSFPFFMMGLFFKKHNVIINNNLIFTICLIGFLLLFGVELSAIKIPFWGLFTLLRSFFAIIIILYIIKSINIYKAIPRMFNYIGLYSLEIYILHSFFKYKAPIIGQYLLTVNDYSTSIIIQLIYGIISSIIIICTTLLVITILNKSSFLNAILFGKFKK